MTSTFDGIKMDRTPFNLNLKNVTKYDDGAILLEYSVINKWAMKKIKRIILITGETRGFGFETAKLFIKNGDIICGFSRNEFNYEGIYHQIGDITNEEDCKKCVENIIQKYGRIDILVNNAGFGIFGPVEETSIEDARKQLDVTFFGAYIMTKQVLKVYEVKKNNDQDYSSPTGGSDTCHHDSNWRGEKT